MRVVIVGGGFAGYHAAKSLRKQAGEDVEVVVLNPTDYFLYLPLLPEVAAGILDPRRVAVSIPETLRGVRLVLGVATGVDFDARHVTYTDPEDNEHRIGYDRLVLAAGSVNKLLPIPGVPEYAHGFRGVPEALYLRDHITRQIELAAAADDPAERDARCTFVVVGAGYTGTEVAAQGPAFTAALAKRHPELAGQRIRWLLLDVAERVLPELAGRLGRTADQVLRSRGVEVLMRTSVEHADAKGVTLTNGDAVAARTLVWCVGVRPDPLVAGLGLETAKGRLVVSEQLTVPGRDDVFACGDAAAVPDLTRPGQYTAMTAQHAERQGRLAGRNVAASLGYGRRGTYRHHDLGFVVDLGAGAAAANPLHIPLSGRPAKVVTRAYHLMAMPGNRVRTAADWVLEALTGRQTVQLGLVRSGAVPLDTDSPELPRR
ncbi:NAD(P)/FAD-dependent oxidoreductase [Amycolatopsis sp. CA-126428]|uniref:NAD(P)/FAD-dependent oxidoreductase n=1 Tax=Amycolatopsis sp. CA-126428 TaxID=2073158 RepID=UPI000CD0C7F2|nr:NAD(P)/FAD-dependent oxidoreductase [Amycolatopsis sp. CA-126428]